MDRLVEVQLVKIYTIDHKIVLIPQDSQFLTLSFDNGWIRLKIEDDLYYSHKRRNVLIELYNASALAMTPTEDSILSVISVLNYMETDEPIRQIVIFCIDGKLVLLPSDDRFFIDSCGNSLIKGRIGSTGNECYTDKTRDAFLSMYESTHSESESDSD